MNFAILASLLRPISYYEQIHNKELKKCEEEFQVLSEGKCSDAKLDTKYLEVGEHRNDAHAIRILNA